MKKLMILTALVVSVNAYGFKRDCQDKGNGKGAYTYSVTIVSAQEGATMCRVTLTTGEIAFIRNALAKFADTTKVSRAFYVNNIKNQYSADNNMNNAIRRVVRDFGGAQQRGVVNRVEHTVGDIRSMLDGKLKDVGTEQEAF